MTQLAHQSTPAGKEVESMGKVVVEIELISVEDEFLSRQNLLPSGKIRREKLNALVDTGATLLVIPEDVIERLGLRIIREIPTNYANGHVEVRKIHGPLTLSVMGRTTTFDALAGHKGQPALLGQVPLEALDFCVDPKNQRLIPGHPESPDVQMVDV